MRYLKKLGLFLPITTLATFAGAQDAQAAGDANTRFHVFVPPNNDNNGRDVALIVTAVGVGDTLVDIIDDDTDGDSDDTVSGVSLSRGESQLVLLKDGAVNDDAGGKWDGDFFRISSTSPVVVQMATRSNWQHDWAPSEYHSGIGTSFFLYAPATSGADNDINVYAYQDGTKVTLTDVTVAPTISTGKTSVYLDSENKVLERELQQGEDLIVRNQLGLDVLNPGHTYWVRSTKPVTVQVGHLGQVTGGNQARDGGGFVPSVRGTSTGELFYFSIPHNPGLESEKELRVTCYDNNTTLTLDGATRYSNEWTPIATTTLNAGQNWDQVGNTNQAFRDNDLYRLRVSPVHHRCTVFEANWMETGSIGTSDYASSLASSHGLNVGHLFTAYMGPPGYQTNVAGQGGAFSHLYVSTYQPDTQITAYDVDSGGALFQQTVTLDDPFYADIKIDGATYQALNSNGNRPYIALASSKPVSVLGTNHNDNWMTYFHSVTGHSVDAEVETTTSSLACGESTSVTASCTSTNNAGVEVLLPASLEPIVSSFGANAPAITIESDGRRRLVWPAVSATPTRTFDVTATCATSVGSCTQSELIALSVGCSTTDALGDTTASVRTANIDLSPATTDEPEGFFVQDVLGDGDITASFDVAEETGLAEFRLKRSTNPDGTYYTIATFASEGASSTPRTYSFADGNTQPGTTYFYRLEADVQGCTSTFGPLAITAASGGTSGYEGGLESNGRRANAIARRAVRKMGWGDGGVTPLAGTTDLELMKLLPEVGPRGSLPVESTPIDLPAITNALAVAAADYFDTDGNHTLTALAVLTRGEVYEHSKALCDRAAGARLDDLAISSGPRGELLQLSLVDSRNGTRDWGVELRLFSEGDGYQAYPTWATTQLPTPAPTQSVVSLQLWSSEPGVALSYAEDIVATWDVDGVADSAVGPPRYIRQLDILGGRLMADLSEGRAEEERIAVVATDEQGDAVTWLLRPHGGLVDADLGRVREVAVELHDADGKLIDRAWASDGAWTAIDDSLWGGQTTDVSFEGAACPAIESSVSADRCKAEGAACLELAGCGQLEAMVDEVAGIARTFSGGAAPVDMSDYETMEVFLESDQPVRACFELASRMGEEAPCVDLPAQSQGSALMVPLSHVRIASTCEEVDLTDVQAITFLTTASGPTYLAVSDLALSRRPTALDGTEPTCAVHTSGEADALQCACSQPGSQLPTGPWTPALGLAAGIAALVRRRRLFAA